MGRATATRSGSTRRRSSSAGSRPTRRVLATRDVLLVGDYNSYAKEDPIRVFETGGFTNLVEQFGGPTPTRTSSTASGATSTRRSARRRSSGAVTGVARLPHQRRRAVGPGLQHDFKTAGQITLALRAGPVPRLRPRPRRRRARPRDRHDDHPDRSTPTTQQYSDKVTLRRGDLAERGDRQRPVPSRPTAGRPTPTWGARSPSSTAWHAWPTVSRFSMRPARPCGSGRSSTARTTTRTRATRQRCHRHEGGRDRSSTTPPTRRRRRLTRPAAASWTGPLVPRHRREGARARPRRHRVARPRRHRPGRARRQGSSRSLAGGSSASPVRRRRDRHRLRQTVPFTCTSPARSRSGPIEVVVDVTGAYYTGHVRRRVHGLRPEPRLRHRRRAASCTRASDVTFGFVMKYTKKRTNLKGSFIAVATTTTGP